MGEKRKDDNAGLDKKTGCWGGGGTRRYAGIADMCKRRNRGRGREK
jgi:hypothetical protein